MIFNVSCPLQVYFDLQSNSVLLKCSTHVGPHILRIPWVQLLALPSVSPPRPLGAIHRLDWHICRFETARNWQFHIQVCSPPTDTFEGGNSTPWHLPLLALGSLSAGPRDLHCQFALRPANNGWNLFLRSPLKIATRNYSLGIVQLS